jgi:hypothetical protein
MEQQKAMRLLLAAALLLSLSMLLLSWNLPILEMHSFRQTQTAISSYWMATTSNWIAYPTPILGYPWSIPLEFPFYQGVVLLVASVLPVNLDQAGRLVSWLFAIACLWPLRRCLIEVSGRERIANLSSLLFLLSPLYLFWSRAFLIESTALFFSLSYVALVATYLRRPRPLLVVAMAICALLGALVKITTFFGFSLAAALVMLAHLYRHRSEWNTRDRLRLYAPVVVTLVVAVLATRAWVQASDVEKARTVWGSAVGSGNLGLWNFGTWPQRISAQLWRDVVFGRASSELMGFTWLVVLLGLPALIARGNRVLAWSALLLYLAPFLVFTNVHIVHNYYQYANGIFLLVFAACGVDRIIALVGPRLGLAATVLVCVLMLIGFRRDFLGRITQHSFDTPTLALAAFARSHTKPDEVILGFGLDWSAEVPYYATRRAMLVPDWITPDALKVMRADPRRYTGGLPLGLVIVCPNQLGNQAQSKDDYRLLLDSVIQGRSKSVVHGCIVYR